MRVIAPLNRPLIGCVEKNTKDNIKTVLRMAMRMGIRFIGCFILYMEKKYFIQAI